MLIIEGNRVADHAELMEQAWRLRHDVFVEEMGWEDIRKPDGREIDQFDDEHAVHLLIREEDELVGYSRMLPTTRPYLLSAVYPHLCETALPQSAAVWEWTRFAVRRSHRQNGHKLSPIGNRVLAGIVSWGLERGVGSIVIEMNPVWLLRLVQLHFRVMPLGLCQEIGGAEVLAVEAGFDARTLARLDEFHAMSRASSRRA